jgi:hypothetical protein
MEDGDVLVRWLPLLLCGSSPATSWADPGGVTLPNRSGFKLKVHLSTLQPGAILAKAGSAAPSLLAFGEEGGAADLRLEDGLPVTLKAERGDLGGRLVLWRQESQVGIFFHGTVDHLSTLRPAAAGGEARTDALVPGPIPRNRILG